MFRKLAVAAICFSCLNVIADSCPFGINIGQVTIKDLPQNIVAKQAVASAENIAGYKEVNLNPANFAINGDYPSQAKLYANASGVIEAIIITYDKNNVQTLTSDLDKKYPKMYQRKTFYGSHDIEYINDDCLIRVIKSFGQGTKLIYGTINWFERYDLFYNQLDEIREKRRAYASEHKSKQKVRQAKKFKKKKQKRRNPWGELLKEFGMFDDFDNMFDKAQKRHRDMFCDDCFPVFDDAQHEFRTPKFMNKHDKNCNVKVYKTSQSYSKNGDVEEWIYNDNGKITKVVKTPEGTRVSHDGGSEKLIEKNEESTKKVKSKKPNFENKLKLYGQMIDDINL